MVEAAYAGSRGVHLFAASGSGQVDQLPDQYLALGSKLQQLVPNPFYGLISSGTLANPTVQQGQLLLPFPQYTSVSVTGLSNRDSIYHSLQMKMEKRFHKGGTVLAAYTWSKFISDADTITTWLDPTGTIQDYNNLRNERALLGSDVPQHVVISYVYDVPIGKGHRLLGNVNGFAGKLVSGYLFTIALNLCRALPVDPSAFDGDHRFLPESTRALKTRWPPTCFDRVQTDRARHEPWRPLTLQKIRSRLFHRQSHWNPMFMRVSDGKHIRLGMGY